MKQKSSEWGVLGIVVMGATPTLTLLIPRSLCSGWKRNSAIVGPWFRVSLLHHIRQYTYTILQDVVSQSVPYVNLHSAIPLLYWVETLKLLILLNIGNFIFQPTSRQLLLGNGLQDKTSEFRRHAPIAVLVLQQNEFFSQKQCHLRILLVNEAFYMSINGGAGRKQGRQIHTQNTCLFQREQIAVPSMMEEAKQPMEWCHIRGSALVSVAGRLSIQQWWW